MSKELLLGPPINTLLPEEYKEYVKSLYERPEDEPPVRGIKIHFGDRTILRFSGDRKKEDGVKKKELRS